MKRILNSLLASLILTTASLQVQAQEKRLLTLEESIDIAKEKNYNMLQLVEEFKIAEFNLKAATAQLRTQISMTLNLPQYTESIREKADSTGVFFPVKELNYTGSLNIRQPLPTDGSIYIQSSLGTFHNYYSGARTGNLNTRFGFLQPLDAIYGYSAIKSNLKSSQLAFERSQKTLKRMELDVVYMVSQYFYNLLQMQRQTEINRLDLERQTEANDIAQNKYAAGLIREVDALQMEVDLAGAQSAHEVSIMNQNSANMAFKQYLGIDLSDSVEISSELQYEPVSIDVERAVELALENSLTLRQQDIQMELQKLDIKRQKTMGKVRGNIEAFFEKVGFSSSYDNLNISNSVNASYRNFLERPVSYGVGLTITIPILDWGQNRSLVRAAEARMKEYSYEKINYERSIETDVRNLVGKIYTNLKRLQLLEKNASVAEKSFDITLKRFSDGDIDSQSLSLERDRLTKAYNTHLDAFINYQLSLADLMRQTFYDFRNAKAVQ
ncbi:MAG: TolC family protein [Tannerella sp.]|jgi:outer membrane protein TolC|nr:TolC family protein [Tannerella sp.]